MYRADGPTEMKPVGETEFVNGTAAMSASGQYGPTRLCRAHCRSRRSAARRRGRAGAGGSDHGRRRPLSRHSAFCRSGMRATRSRRRAPIPSRAKCSIRPGGPALRGWRRSNLTFEAWLYHPQLTDLADLARAYPQTTIVLNHVGGPLGIGPYKDKKAETFAQWKAGITRGREVSKCRRQARRARHADRHVRLLYAPKTAFIGGARDRL